MDRLMAEPVGLLAAALAAAALLASDTRSGPFRVAGDLPPRVVVVAMWDLGGFYGFNPADVRVRRGDRVRFVLDGHAAHNVEFPPAPARVAGGPIGPYVTRRDQAYEILVDDRFPDGVHPFRCAPHEPFGMRGRLLVAGDARRP